MFPLCYPYRGRQVYHLLWRSRHLRSHVPLLHQRSHRMAEETIMYWINSTGGGSFPSPLCFTLPVPAYRISFCTLRHIPGIGYGTVLHTAFSEGKKLCKACNTGRMHQPAALLHRTHSGNQKHRTSLTQSTEVLPQKYGGLCQRSPMFLRGVL